MSSSGLPTLVLELRRWRSEKVVACILTLAGAAAAGVACHQQGSWLNVLAVLATALLLAFGFLRSGWLGGGRGLDRLVWRSDGIWILTCADGLSLEGRLLDSSRMSPAAIWLHWQCDVPATRSRQSHPVRRTIMLLPRDVPRGDFRRLLVRLRLDRSECAPAAAQANS